MEKEDSISVQLAQEDVETSYSLLNNNNKLYLKLITRGHDGHSSKQFNDWLFPQYKGFSLKY